MSTSPRNNTFKPFTVKMALDLAAPHTWPAAIMPALVGICIAATRQKPDMLLATLCVIICILMQSAVNTINDYYDYKKGTDSKSDNVAPDDAVLVYNNVNPKTALYIAIGYIVAAFILGIPCIISAGFAPLIIALIGALFVVIYSAGKSPISYLPLGECASGIVMGGLIPLAIVDVLTGIVDYLVLVFAIPTIIGVGLIMFTNNTSDIERDIPAGRKTLSVMLGRVRALQVYHILLAIWAAAIALIVIFAYTKGILVAICGLLAAFPLIKALLANPMTPERRLQSMPQILSVNIVLGAFYAASILASAVF